MRRCLPTFVLAVALLTSCSGSADTGADSDPPSGSQGSAADSVAAPSDVCGVLSEAFVASIIGPDPLVFPEGSDGCDWQSPQGVDAETDLYSMRLQIASNGAVARAQDLFDSRSVDGIGDEAWLVAGLDGFTDTIGTSPPTLYVTTDDTTFRVFLYPSSDVTFTLENYEASTRLVAQNALANLPELG